MRKLYLGLYFILILHLFCLPAEAFDLLAPPEINCGRVSLALNKEPAAKWMNLLSARSPEVRSAAAEELGSADFENLHQKTLAIERLLGASHDKCAVVRSAAVRSLGLNYEDGLECSIHVINNLFEAVRDKEAFVRGEAFEALMSLKITASLAKMRFVEKTLKNDAFPTVGVRIKIARKASIFIEELCSEAGKNFKRLLWILMKALGDRDIGIRRTAYLGFAKINYGTVEDTRTVEDFLFELLLTGNSFQRENAALILKTIKSKEFINRGLIIRHLAGAAIYDNFYVRRTALEALVEYAADEAEEENLKIALEAVVFCKNEEKFKYNRTAVEGLKKIIQASPINAAALAKAAQEKIKTEGLCSISGRRSRKQMENQLEFFEPHRLQRLIVQLGSTGMSDAKQAAFKLKYADFRNVPDANKSIKIFYNALIHKSAFVRETAALALSRIPLEKRWYLKLIIERLEKCLYDGNPFVREASVRAIVNAGGFYENKDLVPGILISALKSEKDPYVIECMLIHMFSMRDIKPEYYSSLRGIAAGLQNFDNPYVRSAAKIAVERSEAEIRKSS